MQKLAFEVLEGTRNLPFKLPSDAIYILRVSAIVEGLGTTYIENFNGIKDILPILQENIPRALGAKESILETLVDEIKEIPFLAKDFKSAIKKISADELSVELSLAQLEWIKRDIKQESKSLLLTLLLGLGSIFTILYDKELKDIALVLLLAAFWRVLVK
jgi:predicted unusual protein kinase regulating ubiquinone biosynthesis (AarF/ABC1/UbiB family)